MVDCNCGGGDGDRSPKKRYGMALKFKSADERLVRAKTNLNAFSFLAALSGLVGVGVVLFVVGLVVWSLVVL